MKSYEQALNEIYSKAEQQMAEMYERKKRRMVFMLSVVPMCILFVVTASIGIAANKRHHHPIIDASRTDKENTLKTDSTVSSNVYGGTDASNSGSEGSEIPSIYPNTWKKINAVIVKWGDQNEQTWSETYGGYDGKSFVVEYVGVNIELITVYSDTMKESLILDVENIIGQAEYLMIPKHHLDEIRAGDTALVFLEQIARVGDQAVDGTFLGTYTTVLGVKAGNRIDSDQYVPAPIFSIENEKVIVGESAYGINPKNGEYYMSIMTCLEKANDLVRKTGTEFPIFENGISVEDLGKLFHYICN